MLTNKLELALNNTPLWLELNLQMISYCFRNNSHSSRRFRTI